MIPKVSTSDYLREFLEQVPAAQHPAVARNYATHTDRLELLGQFKACWHEHLGHLFECPSDGQLFKWLKISKWDFQIVVHAVEDLRSRAKHPMDAEDPYRHALNHYSASLVRRMRGKYGPPPERKAA